MSGRPVGQLVAAGFGALALITLAGVAPFVATGAVRRFGVPFNPTETDRVRALLRRLPMASVWPIPDNWWIWALETAASSSLLLLAATSMLWATSSIHGWSSAHGWRHWPPASDHCVCTTPPGALGESRFCLW